VANRSELRGLRALVTGASSGIGADLARELAAHGANLVLTARRRAPLEALADELRATGVQVDVITADLGDPEVAHTLWRAASAGGAIDVVVNNAGFGSFRRFGQVEWARDVEMLQLNITSLVELCHLFVGSCAGRAAPAYLLNVASTAAFQAVPNMASYAATKAYVLAFTEALHDEQRGGPLRVTCVCPGGTVTPFHAAAGAGDYGKLANASMLTAREVARQGIAGVRVGRRIVVPGFMNKVSTAGVRLVPRAIASRLASWLMGAPRDAALPGREVAAPVTAPVASAAESRDA
jgi:short-subunit dehydrogenase